MYSKIWRSRLLSVGTAYLLSVALLFCGLALPVTSQSPQPEQAQTDAQRPEVRPPFFRTERRQVPGGAELITIFARTSAFSDELDPNDTEMPLVSVLRDTLGDNIPENDQLRFVWLLNYTKPSFFQRLTSAVPFLYSGATNRRPRTGEVPPHVVDINGEGEPFLNSVLWFAFRRLVLNEASIGAKASVLQYRQNSQDREKAAIESLMAILSLYQETTGEKTLTTDETKDIYARLALKGKPLAGRLQQENLHRAYNKDIAIQRDYRGHNWELLRQYAEFQGLYFDPVEMPDGSARHALVWIAEEDLNKPRERKFDGRFLNIKDPWTDGKIRNWKGYKDVRWFDADDREVDEDTPGATKRTLIPLAMYGFDYPKIPVILIDFRDSGNPKRRELSKRILHDITDNVLSISKFSSLPYFVGRYVYDFTTARRGMDINQSSRAKSYMQLKLLISLDATIDQQFREEMLKRSSRLSINPLENTIEAEAVLARAQYQNLINYAERPDGLKKRLDRDRSREMVKVAHSRKALIWFGIARALTFGIYEHKEKETPELFARMDLRRQLQFHERYVRETVYETARPEIDSNVAQLQRSLVFLAANGNLAGAKTARGLGKIFTRTEDDGLRELALAGLYKINNQTAKNELLAIYRNQTIDDKWRKLSASYLRRAVDEGQKISKENAAAINGISGN